MVGAVAPGPVAAASCNLRAVSGLKPASARLSAGSRVCGVLPLLRWSFWSPTDQHNRSGGDQSSTFTQRAEDAARAAAQDDSDLLDEADFEEYWRLHTEDLY